MSKLTYIANIKNQLLNSGFTAETQLGFFDEPIDFLARKTKFMLWQYSIVQIIVAIASFPRIDQNTLLQFSKSCQEYAWHAQGFLWLHASLLVPKYETLAFPIIIVDESDSAIIDTVSKSPPIQDSLLREISIPILIEIDKKKLHYSHSISRSSKGLRKYSFEFIEENIEIDGSKKISGVF